MKKTNSNSIINQNNKKKGENIKQQYTVLSEQLFLFSFFYDIQPLLNSNLYVKAHTTI